MPNTITSIGSNAFYVCPRLKEIQLSNIITEINTSLFSNCTSLKTILIPDTVTKIKGSAFSGCTALMNVTIPINVTNIDAQAFWGCSSVEEYHFKPTIPPTFGTNVFGSSSSFFGKIYVPYSSDHSILEAYKTANNFSQYANFIYEEPTSTE